MSTGVQTNKIVKIIDLKDEFQLSLEVLILESFASKERDIFRIIREQIQLLEREKLLQLNVEFNRSRNPDYLFETDWNLK